MQALEQAEHAGFLARRQIAFLWPVLCSGFVGFPHPRQQIKQMEEKGGKKRSLT